LRERGYFIQSIADQGNIFYHGRKTITNALMNHYSLSVSAYWRNSLADAELGRGGWHDNEISSQTIRSRTELNNAFLDRQVTQDFFKAEPDDIDEVEIAIYPLMFKLKTEHGSKRQYALPTVITPVVIKGLLKRDGHFFAFPKVFIARDLLEPLDKGSFSIGHIDKLDEFLTNHPCPLPHDIVDTFNGIFEAPDESSHFSQRDLLKSLWRDTLSYCDLMLNEVCQDDRIAGSGYLRAREWMLRKIGGNDTPSKRISSLYDHLRQVNPDCPLFDTFAGGYNENVEPLLPMESGFAKHLGHCNDQHPLATAQRDALTHILHMADGDVLAVNGPPGTGKTTLLLSIVANQWIEAGLANRAPPIIVATSTNNQSVTNVLDAFRKDITNGSGVLSGRWISALNNYGFYLSSRAKRQQTGARYPGPDFFDQLESVEGIAQARSDYLFHAAIAYPDIEAPSLKKIVARLHDKMQRSAAQLTNAQQLHDESKQLQATLNRALGKNPYETLQRFENEADEAQKRYRVFESAYLNLVNHLGNQPFWYDLLKFIPSVSRQQGVRASLVVKRTITSIPPEKVWSSADNLKMVLHEKMKNHKAVASKHQMRVRRAHALIKKLGQCKVQLAEAYRTLMPQDGALLPKEPASLKEATLLADTTLRFRLFQLATHYWEGRWLLEVENNEAALLREMGSLTPDVVQRRWQRRMMLMPCAVSTLFMLPGEFKVHRDDDPNRHSYLYNFIDLLIVDEAGQVLPEVAGASFALAKKAVVIGDTLQIEPIWNIPKSVDIGNILQNGLLPSTLTDADLEDMQASGRMASCGNVMTIAQQASRYHYDEELSRGMYLYEHRRCFNEIISFCNALAYKNRLIPSRGRHQDLQMPPNPFPPMGYINVAGQCRSKTTGTRMNLLEAETIAQWIAFNREDLEQLYGLRVEQIIGVVTPFVGQVEALRNSCRKQGIDVSSETGMTIGTVHSLQGAERHIVLFSPTYSKDNNGQFIDSSNSMLNVAVSRAKDNFILVGDMRLFNPKQIFTPRGLLATFMLKNENNRIHFQAVDEL
jgi:hypothetical protein